MKKAIPWALGLVIAAGSATMCRAQAPFAYNWQPEEPQGAYTQTWHDGFRAGATAANADIAQKLQSRKNLQLDPDRHTMYTHPDLAPIASEEFQAGFAFAYQEVVDHRYYRGGEHNPADAGRHY
jgi:hypothetical protein